MPTFKLTSGDKTLKLTTGTKKFRIRTVDLFGINEGGVPIGAAGGDLSGTYPDPNVSGMKETGAGANLIIGAIADGQTLVRSGGDIVGSTGSPPGGIAGGDLSGTYPDPSVVALTESSSPASLPIGDIGDDNDVLVRSGTDIVGAHELKDISKIQGGAVASFRGMTFNSVTGEVDILHGSSPTSITGLNMLSLTNRADVAPNSERKILFTADVNSLLSYDVTNEASDASYNTNISDTSVNRSLSFGGMDALTVGNLDETAIVRHKATPSANFKTKIVLEHERGLGSAIDARAFFGVEKSSAIGAEVSGEIMVETNGSSLYLGAGNSQYQRIYNDNTSRIGSNLDPNTSGFAVWRRWAVEVDGNTANNGIRIFEPEFHNIIMSVLAISASARGSNQSYNWPNTTAGGTIAQFGSSDFSAVVGLFPYYIDNLTGIRTPLDRDLIITASGNQALLPFNDAIKLKHDGGIDIWGDTEFFDTVTAASFVGPVTGDIVGDLWGSVYATDGSGPVLTSPATTPGNVAINALGATGIIEFYTNSALAMTIDSDQNITLGNDPTNWVATKGFNLQVAHQIDATTATLNIAPLRTVNGQAQINLISSEPTGTWTTFGLRMLRDTDSILGDNGASYIDHHGTGGFYIRSLDLAPLTLRTNNTNAVAIDSLQNIVMGNAVTNFVKSKGFKLDVGYGIDATAVYLQLGHDRSVSGPAHINLISSGPLDLYPTYGFRIFRGDGDDGPTLIEQKGEGNLTIKTAEDASFVVITNSATAMTINSSQITTFGPLGSSSLNNFKIDPGSAATIGYNGEIKVKDTGVHLTTNVTSRGVSLGGNDSVDFHVHKTSDGGNSQAGALYVTDIATDPTAFLPAPSTAYNIINRQNTVCASGKFTVVVATSVTTSSNHFGIDETTTDASGYVAAGQFYVYLDRKVEPDATILVSTNAQLSWSAAALSSCGAHLDSSGGPWQYKRILVTVGGWFPSLGIVQGLDSDFSLAVIGIMDDDP